MPIYKCSKCGKTVHVSGVDNGEFEKKKENLLCFDCFKAKEQINNK